jgi:hypothetical protein
VIAFYAIAKGINKTAKHFQLSPRTISNIINPDKPKNKQQNNHTKYYNKEKHRIAVNKFRVKKRLYKLTYTATKRAEILKDFNSK